MTTETTQARLERIRRTGLIRDSADLDAWVAQPDTLPHGLIEAYRRAVGEVFGSQNDAGGY